MRIICLLILLAGCAPTNGVFRPETPEQWQAVNGQIGRINPLLARLGEGSADLCAVRRAGCPIRAIVGVGRFYAGMNPEHQAILMTDDLARYLRNDDELLLVLGHEWAHLLLRHGYGASTPSKETAADCAGTLLAKRAGADIPRGALVMKRLQGTSAGLMRAVFDAGTHPDFNTRYLRIRSVAANAPAGEISIRDIERICEVRF